jgi:hypothetical protein
MLAILKIFLCTHFLINRWDVKKNLKDYDLDYIKTKIKVIIACKTHYGMVEAFSDLLLFALKHDMKSTKKLEEIEEKKFIDPTQYGRGAKLKQVS